MTKAMMLTGLTMIVGLLTIAAIPASALIRSGNGSTTGKAQSGAFTFTDEGASFECEKGEGEWELFELESTKKPPVGRWARFKAKVMQACTFAHVLASTVKGCWDALHQPSKGALKATASVEEECVLTATGNCEVKISVSKANENLKEVQLENSEANLLSIFNVSGIASTATSLGGLGCIGIKSGKNSLGTEKVTVTGAGLNAI